MDGKNVLHALMRLDADAAYQVNSGLSIVNAYWHDVSKPLRTVDYVKDGLKMAQKALEKLKKAGKNGQPNRTTQTPTKWLTMEIRNDTGRAECARLAADEAEVFDRLVTLCEDGISFSVKWDDKNSRASAYAIFPLDESNNVVYAVSAFGGDAAKAIVALLVKIDFLLQTGDMAKHTDNSADFG